MSENCEDESEGKAELDLTFNNTEEAFRSKTFGDLVRGYIVFLMCSSKLLVRNSEKLMKASEKIFGNKIFSLVMRMTVFGHFVGGETEEELAPRLALLRKYGVKSILDYAVEEDLSKEEAEEKEMSASISHENKSAKDSEIDELGGELAQFKPIKQFADRRTKVSSARTYFYENEELCERNADYFIKSIQTVADQGDGFIAVKLTALGRPQLLFQLSEAIVRARAFVEHITGHGGTVLSHHLTVEDLVKKLEKAGIEDIDSFLKNVTRDKDGLIHLFPWSGLINEGKEVDETFKIPSLRQKKMVTLISKLPDQEKQMFRNTISRMKRIITVAEECNVHIMIDAEQTYFQPAISRICMELMVLYNKKAPVICNTYQSYLKQSFSEIKSDLEQADRQNFLFGFKLVRGAYLDQERDRAKELKYPDPTNESYDKTTEMFNNIVETVFEQIAKNKENNAKKKILCVIASHNEDSLKFVIEKMDCYNIHKDDHAIFFAQLLGMCDYMTYPVGQAGYSSYKYVPYGPLNKVIPYLVRRCNENIGVLTKLKKEKKMLLREIIRRVLKGKIFYKP